MSAAEPERPGGDVETTAEAVNRPAALRRAMGWIELLSSEVGPRRPTGRGERLAAELMREELRSAGLEATIERFQGYSSFAWPYGAVLALGVLPEALPVGWRGLRSAIAAAAAIGVATEGSLRVTPLSAALSRRPSQNLVATIEPEGDVERTLCLMAHMDSSRSGLMFHPALVRFLGGWISAQTIAVLAQAAEPFAGRRPAGRAALRASRALLAAGLLLLVEREVRGQDVAGANDNASGLAVVAQLAAERAAAPLRHTRLVLLLTGCEEAGTLGARAFLSSRDTSGWLFLNFDNVGGAATLRYLRREGVIARFRADPALIAAAERVAIGRMDLGLEPTDSPAGLTYDTSPVLARGGRGLTLSAQDGYIPNLHWPTDTFENVDGAAVDRALEAGRELIAAVDRGEADGDG